MGNFSITSDRTGQVYNVLTAGDTPTPEESSRASAMIKQADDAAADKYESETGRRLPMGDSGNAIARGVDRAKTTGYNALGISLESVGGLTGLDGIASLGQGMQGDAREEQVREAVNMPAPTQFSEADSFGSFLTATGEAIGQTIPEMGATIGATIVGTAVGGPAGGLAAGTSVGLPLFYGRNIDTQRSEVAAGNLSEVNEWNAFMAAGGQSLLSAVGTKLVIGAGAAPAKNLFSRVGRAAVDGTVAEIPTELGQEVLQRLQAGQSLDDDDAMETYFNVAVGAGLIGGGVGSVGGAVRGIVAPDPAIPAPLMLPPPDGDPNAPAGSDSGGATVTVIDDGSTDVAPVTADDLASVAGDSAISTPDRAARTRAKAVSGAVDAEVVGAVDAEVGDTSELLKSLGIPARLPVAKSIAALDPSDPKIDQELAKWSRTGPAKKARPAATTATKEYLDRRAAARTPVEVDVEDTDSDTGIVDSAVGVGTPTVESADVQQSDSSPAQGSVEPTSSDTAGVDRSSDATAGSGRSEVEVPTALEPEVDVPDTPAAVEGPKAAQNFFEQARINGLKAAQNQSFPAPVDTPATVEGPKAAQNQSVPDAVPSNTTYADRVRNSLVDVPADVLVEPDEIAARTAAAQQSTIDREAASRTVTGATTGATPGAVSGSSAQLVPRGVPGVDRTRTAEPPATMAPPLGADALPARVSTPSNEVARQAIAADFAETASTELQSQERVYSGGYGALPDSMSAADYSAVTGLLRRPASMRTTAASKAAFKFFSKNSDPMNALVEIAFDRDPTSPKVRKPSADMKVIPEYYQGTGRNAAELAYSWIANNLSVPTIDFVDLQTAELSAESARSAIAAYEKSEQTADARKELDDIAAQAFLNLEAGGKDTQAVNREMDQFRADAKSRGITLASPAGNVLMGLDARPHPGVVNALRAGNISSALEGIAATSGVRSLRTLATNLAPFMDGVTVRVVPSTGSPTNAQGSPNPLWMDTVGGVGREAQGIYDQATNSITLADTMSGLNTQTILHEALHAALTVELQKPASLFGKRVGVLMDRINEVYAMGTPKSDPEYMQGQFAYGMSSPFEFVSNGMTNSAFMSVLDRIPFVSTDTNVDGARKTTVMSMLQRLKEIYASFVRAVMQRSPAPVASRSITEELDTLVNELLTVPGALVNTNPLYSTATNPETAMASMNSMAGRVVSTTSDTAGVVMRSMTTSGASLGLKKFIANTAIPLRNMADFSKPYFGDLAMAVYNNASSHNAAIKAMNDTNRATIDVIAGYMKRFPGDIAKFNDMAFQASQFGIDPRSPEAHFKHPTLQYWTMKPDGRPDKLTVVAFSGADGLVRRAKKILDLNTNTPASRGRATVKNTPQKDGRYEKYQALRAQLDQLNATSNSEAQGAYGRMLGLYKNMHSDAARVFKARVEAMLPGNEAMQRSVYNSIFNKMFTVGMLEAYLPLQRFGNHWLTYTAADPDTGEMEVFKQTFESVEARRAEIEALEAKAIEDPTTKIADIQSFQSFREFQERGAPTSFVAKTVLKIDESVRERSNQAGVDARAAAVANGVGDVQADAIAELAASNYRADAKQDTDKLKEDLVNIALDMMPERSFLQNYKKRSGTSGFEGGRTPIGKEFAKHHMLNLMMNKSSSMSRQLADMEYGAVASRLSREMQEMATLKSASGTMTDAETQNMQVSLDVLTQALDNIKVHRHPLIKALNTGTYMMTLGFNASSAVLNMTGLPTIVAPYLSGKYGGRETTRALVRATKVIAGSGRERIITRVTENGDIEEVSATTGRFEASIENLQFNAYDTAADFNTAGNTKARYATLVNTMRERGLLADSMHYDNLDVQGMATGGIRQKMVTAGAFFMHQTEKHVRETTAIAAFDLELAKIAKDRGSDVLTQADLDAAALEAAYTTEVTNGAIAAAASPNNAQRGIMPMMYMFKRYPMAIYGLLGTLGSQSFPGHKVLLKEFGSVDDPGYKEGMEMRKVARMQLAYIVGSVGMFAGVAGLPLYGAMTGIMDTLFKDEDELDADTLIRLSIGEGASRGLINYLFGVEASSRMGLAHMFYRDPFRSENNPPLWNLLEGLGGPAISLSNSMITRGRDLIERGETGRAIEALTPASVRNVLKAIRFQETGGATSMRGDMIAEVGAGGILGQALGFSPAAFIRQAQINGAVKSIDANIAARKTALLKRLNIAKRFNDVSAETAIMEDIAAFNERNSDTPIDDATIKRSGTSFTATTARVMKGLTFNPKTEERMFELLRSAER